MDTEYSLFRVVGTDWSHQRSAPGWKYSSDGRAGKQAGAILNDTWRSTDKGATWTLVNGSSGWPARMDHGSVVLPDGSIVLVGRVEYPGRLAVN